MVSVLSMQREHVPHPSRAVDSPSHLFFTLIARDATHLDFRLMSSWSAILVSMSMNYVKHAITYIGISQAILE